MKATEFKNDLRKITTQISKEQWKFHDSRASILLCNRLRSKQRTSSDNAIPPHHTLRRSERAEKWQDYSKKWSHMRNVKKIIWTVREKAIAMLSKIQNRSEGQNEMSIREIKDSDIPRNTPIDNFFWNTKRCKRCNI